MTGLAGLGIRSQVARFFSRGYKLHSLKEISDA